MDFFANYFTILWEILAIRFIGDLRCAGGLLEKVESVSLVTHLHEVMESHKTVVHEDS